MKVISIIITFLLLFNVGISYAAVGVTSPGITDNAVPRGDGGASIFQDSGVLIDDSDNVTIPGKLLKSSAAETCGSGEGADLCTDAPTVDNLYITSTAATTDVLAVADGVDGSIRTFTLIVDGGANVEVTPTNMCGSFVKVTLANTTSEIFENVVLQFTSNAGITDCWNLVSTTGVAS